MNYQPELVVLIDFLLIYYRSGTNMDDKIKYRWKWSYTLLLLLNAAYIVLFYYLMKSYI